MKLKPGLKGFLLRHQLGEIILAILVTILIVITGLILAKQRQLLLQTENDSLKKQVAVALSRVQELDGEIATLQAVDLRQENNTLRQQMLDLSTAYKSSLANYEEIIKLQELPGAKVVPLQITFASVLNLLSLNNLSGAKDANKKLVGEISKEKARLAALASVVVIPANIPQKNEPPSSGFSRQKVTIEGTSFLVDIVAADLGSTKVVVDTTSEGTCTDNCPVLPLATYVSRSGAYAGINGSYFCPATYPSCAGKTNSFDLLLMNKNKVYFNSDNNVDSTNPGVIFGGGYIRFVSKVSDWGRDTGIDSMISNYPLLVFDKQISFGGDSDAKQSARSNRSFVANQGNKVFIGVVHGVTVAESAKVLHALSMDNALNLDAGGSVALWSGGYKDGPGRELPNAILFVRK